MGRSSLRDVRIADCDLSTGDDSIAGLYWENVRIERCKMNSASSGIRIFGPARHVTIADCQMFGPGRHPSPACRLLHHTNMGAGLCIQPNAWGDTPGEVDDVHVSDIQMREVQTPLHLATKARTRHVNIDRLRRPRVSLGRVGGSWSLAPVQQSPAPWDVHCRRFGRAQRPLERVVADDMQAQGHPAVIQSAPRCPRGAVRHR